jgi:hypothetical protein
MLLRGFALAGLGAASSLVVARSSFGANVASPGVNPDVRPVGTTTFGNVGVMNFLNDGVEGNTAGASMFQVPYSSTPGIPPGSRGFGYDFGRVATIESIDLSQFTGESPLGPRRRFAEVAIHTAAGVFGTTLDEADDVHFDFPSTVVTSWLMIEPLSQYGGGDPQVGFDELVVNSASGTLAPRRTNVAAGKAYTLPGSGWNNVRGNLTDNLLAGSNHDLTSAAFNGALTSPGNSINLDLGEAFTVEAIGLAEHDYGGAGGRQLIETMRLEFSDDPDFTNITATRDLLLANIGYQVVEFDPATGQYVRLVVDSQYLNPDANLGFTEVQFFQSVVPEPAALGVAATALPLLLRRRR